MNLESFQIGIRHLSVASIVILLPFMGNTGFNANGLPLVTQNILDNNTINNNTGSSLSNVLNAAGGFLGVVQNPQQQQSVDFQTKEIYRIVSKWSGTGANHGENYASDMTSPQLIAADNDINADRNFLNTVLNGTPLPADLQNQVAQILYVLDLQQIRVLSKQIKDAQPNFYNSLQAYIRGQAPQPQGNRTKKNPTFPEAWYKKRKSELEALLLKFKALLATRPEYLQNPPALLAGLQEALSSGSDALSIVTQEAGCFGNPNQPICLIKPTTPAPSTGNTGSSSYGRSDYGDDSQFGDDNRPPA